MSRFEDRLWRDLVRDHGADLDATPGPESRGRRARPRMLAGTSVGLAGLGGAIALVIGAASTSPAFAVTQSNDGTVNVVIRSWDALHAVNARMEKLGFRAKFVEAAAGCAAPPPAVVARLFSRQHERVASVTVQQGLLHARFDPRQIPAGQTLVMGAWRQRGAINVGPGSVVAGATPTCLPVPTRHLGAVAIYRAGGRVQCIAAPDSPPGGNGGTSNSGNSGTGNSGNSGTGSNSANSGTAVAGDSGNAAAVNSGSPSATDTGTTPTRTEVLPAGAGSGNSGTANGGNSGTGGNSGNSGTATSGDSGNSGTASPGNSGNSGATAQSYPPGLPCPGWAQSSSAKKALALAREARAKAAKATAAKAKSAKAKAKAAKAKSANANATAAKANAKAH